MIGCGQELYRDTQRYWEILRHSKDVLQLWSTASPAPPSSGFTSAVPWVPCAIYFYQVKLLANLLACSMYSRCWLAAHVAMSIYYAQLDLFSRFQCISHVQTMIPVHCRQGPHSSKRYKLGCKCLTCCVDYSFLPLAMYKVRLGEEILMSPLLSDGFPREVAFRWFLSEREHFDYLPLVPVKGTDGIQATFSMKRMCQCGAVGKELSHICVLSVSHVQN